MELDAEFLKKSILVLSVSLPRMLVMFGVMPFFGSGMMQVMVRNTLVVCLGLGVYPLVFTQLPDEIRLLPWMMVIAKEAMLGVVLGYLGASLFWVAEGVGLFIDNQRGASMAQMMDPMSGVESSPLGSLLMQVLTVLFFTTGGFLVFLGGIYESYQVWPVFSAAPALDAHFAEVMIQHSARIIEMIVLFAAPIVIAVFVAEFGLGLINRFSPQLNIFFLSMSIKSVLAIVFLIAYMVTLLTMFDGEQRNLWQHLMNLDHVLKVP
ncbi:type III secretion system export apparatus subunit SctT [Acanthopleuribacter pedis]|uniref:Type III secretion system export apparatus subunit SctT n=1 Tax=Acanthopleuribacter pedis TaxID=442870 RepID=A0A8J7QBA5_9BACT|nr:type III secretion system export apparatus subunit SctT [Acanthopleuribacter pedis]MBO1322972.1 type III secretion system export apparatus subunit SctT [Acanthopleuribacter pedis]